MEIREDYYKEINEFIDKNCEDRASGDAYFAYIVAESRAIRKALSDAMQHMLDKDPEDIRIQAAYAIEEALGFTDALWEDYNIGAPIDHHPLSVDGERDCADEPACILRHRIAEFPHRNRIGAIYGGKPEEWVKKVIDEGTIALEKK